MTIIPSILTDEVTLFASQLAQIVELGEVCSLLQVDVIDGEFADNVTVTPLDLQQFEFGELQLDIHLMTQEPLDFVYELKEVANELNIRAVVAQIERMSSQQHFVEEVKKNNWLPGLSLNPYTPLSSIDDEVWEDVRVLQIMGVEAGFQGQTFVQQSMKLAVEAREFIDSHGYEIELIVDGGVTPAIAAELEEVGVDAIAIGSALFKAPTVAAALETFEEVIG